VAGEAFLSKLLERTEDFGMTGMSCCGKPSTSAPTVAVALGTAEGEAATVPDAVPVEEAAADGVAGAVLEGVPDDAGEADSGATGLEVQAEATTATLTASRARPRVVGDPGSFTGVSFLGLTPGLSLQFSQWPGIVLPL
jgi:hypothetical protein